MRAMTLLIGLLLAGPVIADEVEDQIQRALDAWRAGDVRLAAEELQFAQALVNRARAGSLDTLMPEPLDGWTAEPVENNTAQMAAMGGGAMLSRYYRNDNGAELQIEMMGGSPMVMAGLSMIANPMMLDEGMKPVRHNGHRGVLESDGEDHELTLGVGGQVMVRFDLSGAPAETLDAWVAATDLEAVLQAMGNP